MNDQNNFNQENKELPSAPEQEKKELEKPAEEKHDEEKKQTNPPQPMWYSVSYQGNGGMPYMFAPPMPQKKKSKLGLVALILLAAMMLSAFVGIGVYLNRNEELPEVSEPMPNVPSFPNGNTVNGLGGEDGNPTYEYADTSYDYTAAFAQLTKNDGATLVGSPNGSAGAAPKSLIEATAAVKDSVVEITTTIVSNRGGIKAGAGSGVIIHADGVVITNNHVVEGSDKIYVRLTNGDTYEAALRGTDAEGDIAILKITPQEGKPFTVAKLGSSKSLALGEPVFAIGNPLGELGGTVTNGIISATEREVTVDGVKMKLLQTNAAINSGNSGGGLFNLAGELVGVVNAKYSASGVEGLGFAIPIDTAYEKSIKDLMEVGYIRGVPALGVTLMEQQGTNMGAIVYGAYVYNAGDVDGMRAGDYIYSIDGTVVYATSTSALATIKSIVRSHKVGDVLQIVLLRNGQQVSVSVTLKEYVPQL